MSLSLPPPLCSLSGGPHVATNQEKIAGVCEGSDLANPNWTTHLSRLALASSAWHSKKHKQSNCPFITQTSSDQLRRLTAVKCPFLPCRGVWSRLIFLVFLRQHPVQTLGQTNIAMHYYPSNHEALLFALCANIVLISS